MHPWFGWTKQAQKRPRAMESVILDEDLSEKLTRDMRKFLGNA
jgi:hypothetical protein